MRFMILVKASADSEAAGMSSAELQATMAAYHRELADAGVLLDGNALKASRFGWRVRGDGERRHVVDGPFSDTKQVVAGYTMIQVRSRDEALAWSRRFPNPAVDGGETQIEVHEVFEPEDFAVVQQ